MAEKLKLVYTILGVTCFSAFLIGKCMNSIDCAQEEPKKQMEEKNKKEKEKPPAPKPENFEKLKEEKVLTRLAYLKASRKMSEKMKHRKHENRKIKRC